MFAVEGTSAHWWLLWNSTDWWFSLVVHSCKRASFWSPNWAWARNHKSEPGPYKWQLPCCLAIVYFRLWLLKNAGELQQKRPHVDALVFGTQWNIVLTGRATLGFQAFSLLRPGSCKIAPTACCIAYAANTFLLQLTLMTSGSFRWPCKINKHCLSLSLKVKNF